MACWLNWFEKIGKPLVQQQRARALRLVSGNVTIVDKSSQTQCSREVGTGLKAVLVEYLEARHAQGLSEIVPRICKTLTHPLTHLHTQLPPTNSLTYRTFLPTRVGGWVYKKA